MMPIPRVFVKPAAPDLVVLDENNVRIAAEGRAVPKTTFISRLIKEGALVVEDEFTPKLPKQRRQKTKGNEQ